MSDAFESDAVSPALQALLELFNRELGEVKFPDVDGEVLEEGAVRVRRQAEAVARAQAALEAARRELHEAQEALQQKGQRALAYARVYAEDDAELSAKLESVHLPRPMRKPARGAEAPQAEAAPLATGEEGAPKRRGRPPKARAAAGATLFSEEAPAEALTAPHVNGVAHLAPPTA